MAGMSESGFTPKRFNEVVSSLQDMAKPIFQDLVKPGEDVDVGDTSTIGRFIGLVAPDLSELWQALQEVYQAFDPNSATGVALENIVQYMGIERRLGRSTVVSASVWGTTGTLLPEGQVVRTEGGDRFQSTSPLTMTLTDSIGARFLPTSLVEGDQIVLTIITDSAVHSISHTNGPAETVSNILTDLQSQYAAFPSTGATCTVSNGELVFTTDSYFGYISYPVITNLAITQVKKRLSFQSVEQGPIEAPIGTMTTILTPYFGWVSVNNEIAATLGTTYETDEELRERFRVSKAVRAGNMADALYSRLLELEGVMAVRVYENMTNAVDLKGLPPHSFMAMVRGGANTDIGKVVWNNKPLGIASFGNTQVVINDSQGLERTVNFSRADEIQIKVNITLTKVGNTFPEDGIQQIRDAVRNYISGSASFGESIIYTRLFTPINSVPGHQVDVLEIARNGGLFGTTNIPIDWNEYPVIIDPDINITVTN